MSLRFGSWDVFEFVCSPGNCRVAGCGCAEDKVIKAERSVPCAKRLKGRHAGVISKGCVETIGVVPTIDSALDFETASQFALQWVFPDAFKNREIGPIASMRPNPENKRSLS